MNINSIHTNASLSSLCSRLVCRCCYLVSWNPQLDGPGVRSPEVTRDYAQGMKSLTNELNAESCQLELINAKEPVAAVLEAVLHVKILSTVPSQDSAKRRNLSTYRRRHTDTTGRAYSRYGIRCEKIENVKKICLRLSKGTFLSKSILIIFLSNSLKVHC